MKWLNDLKIAVIEENVEKIDLLTKEVPKFESIVRAKEALALINQAIAITDQKRSETLDVIKKLRQTKSFFK